MDTADKTSTRARVLSLFYHEKGADVMLKITRAWVDDTTCDERGMGTELFVFFDNGASVTIFLDSKANAPYFSDIIAGKYREQPSTDGENVFWGNGARLSYNEVFAILHAERKEEAV